MQITFLFATRQGLQENPRLKAGRCLTLEAQTKFYVSEVPRQLMTVYLLTASSLLMAAKSYRGSADFVANHVDSLCKCYTNSALNLEVVNVKLRLIFVASQVKNWKPKFFKAHNF